MLNVNQKKEEKERRKIAAENQKIRLEQVSTVATLESSQRDQIRRRDESKQTNKAGSMSTASQTRQKSPDVSSPSKNISILKKELVSSQQGSVSQSRPVPPETPIMVPKATIKESNSPPNSLAVARPVETLLMLAKKRCPEEKPSTNGARGESERIKCPPSSHPIPSDNSNVLTIASRDRSSPSPFSSSSPPSIPPYNPAMPDKFPLSNKAEYIMEYKKQTHSYEEVNMHDVRLLQRPLPPSPDSSPPGSMDHFSDYATMEDVPVRRKRRDPSGSLPDDTEWVGKHVEVEKASSSSVEKNQDQKEMAIVDISPLQVACMGLPTCGKQMCTSNVFGMM